MNEGVAACADQSLCVRVLCVRGASMTPGRVKALAPLPAEEDLCATMLYHGRTEEST
jgi:hypothetical protein